MEETTVDHEASSVDTHGGVPPFDTVIVNGDVVDPGSGLVGRYDLAIAAGRVVAVAPTLDPGTAPRVINARGQLVTPGLVDLHTHIYWGATYWGIDSIRWPPAVA